MEIFYASKEKYWNNHIWNPTGLSFLMMDILSKYQYLDTQILSHWYNKTIPRPPTQCISIWFRSCLLHCCVAILLQLAFDGCAYLWRCWMYPPVFLFSGCHAHLRFGFAWGNISPSGKKHSEKNISVSFLYIIVAMHARWYVPVYGAHDNITMQIAHTHALWNGWIYFCIQTPVTLQPDYDSVCIYIFLYIVYH